MKTPDLAKIAALAATGAALGYADPALAQGVTVGQCVEAFNAVSIWHIVAIVVPAFAVFGFFSGLTSAIYDDFRKRGQ